MKTGKSRRSSSLIILLGVVILAVASLALLQKGFPNSRISADLSDQSEDQLSMYQIPDDVLNALSQSKITGKPISGIRSDGPTFHIPILMYHYVEYVKDQGDKIRISLNTLPEVLDQQIATLKQAGYTFITASGLADILDGIEQMPQKPIMLTFDDGYRDFYTYAFPILKKYKVKAVNYVITGFINGDNYLTEKQLQEIAKSGLVEIGAHTVHHLALKGLSKDRVEPEISGSKVALEQKLGIPITAFAYPYGSFDINAIQLVKQAGFRTAVSTVEGSEVSNQVRFLAHRLRPGANTDNNLLKLVQGN